MLIWMIDNEWGNYDIETKAINEYFPQAEIRFSDEDFNKDLIDFGYKADAIICQISVAMNREAINKLENCKVISVYGAGYDKVDVKAAKEKGIYVSNVPGYCVEDVSDYELEAMFRANKMLSSYNEDIKSGLWGAQAVHKKIRRLSSQILFIVGFGRIGRLIAKKAEAIGMSVIFYDPYIKEETVNGLKAKKVNLEQGLSSADFISLNTKLSEETKYFISQNELSMMKEGAYLINASRGKVVNEEALIKAVEAGKLSGATLDVIENEPPSGNEKILRSKGIFVTPHISYLSKDSLNELQYSAAINALKILKGEKIPEIVNL